MSKYLDLKKGLLEFLGTLPNSCFALSSAVWIVFILFLFKVYKYSYFLLFISLLAEILYSLSVSFLIYFAHSLKGKGLAGCVVFSLSIFRDLLNGKAYA
jgi:uncharacterized membrane protein YccC